MNSKYKTIKYKKNKPSDIEDLVSIEEPLEMVVRYKKENEWIDNSISITMRTPKNDEDLIVGLLFCEGIVQKNSEIEKVEFLGDKVGKFDLQNKIRVTLNSGENLDLKHLRRNFLTNSSCGVCGKTSLDSIEVLKTKKIDLSFPKIDYNIILKSPELLQNNQSEFSKTGGIHASALIDGKGKVIAIREDVGRHNALDKLIGHALKNKIIKPENQFIACSGRLNFELVQKALMSNIGLMAGVGAPTSLAIDLAKRFNMTLVGFVKQDSFNIYSNKERIIIKS